MRIKILLAMLFLVLSMTMISATDSNLIYKAGSEIDMKTSCVINGSYCSSATTCNITIIYPMTGQLYANNLEMTNNVNYYNITLPVTNNLGDYNAKVICFDSVAGYSGTQDFAFQVTTTGSTSLGNRTIFIFLLSVSIIILLISLLISNIYLGFISGIAFILSGLYNNIYGIGIEQNMYTVGIGMVIIGLGIVIFLTCAYKALEGHDGFRLVGPASEEHDENDIFKYEAERED